jgi:hypothetical protein
MHFSVIARQLIEVVMGWIYVSHLLPETVSCRLALFSAQTHPKAPFPMKI